MYAAKKFAVAICDDAPQDAELLEKYIKQIMEIDIRIEYTRGDQLLKDVRKQDSLYDVVFLAICMKEESGIDTARELRKVNERVPLIFTTVSDQYYREAFDLYAFQYLLKPVTFLKVKSVLAHLESTEEPSVYFRYRGRVYTIRHNEISYLSSSLHTVYFHLTDGSVLHCRGKLSDFDGQLEDSNIIRCHQSFYVNMDSIIGMKSNSFILKDIVVPISRTYGKKVQEQYLHHLNDSR